MLAWKRFLIHVMNTAFTSDFTKGNDAMTCVTYCKIVIALSEHLQTLAYSNWIAASYCNNVFAVAETATSLRN